MDTPTEITDYELFEVPPRWLFLKVETATGTVGWGEPIVLDLWWRRHIRPSRLRNTRAMVERNRFSATVEGNILYLENDDNRVEIGSMDAIIGLMGGETYTLEYTSQQAGVSWLSTDKDPAITLDVRQELVDWRYSEELVTNVEKSPLDEPGESGYSQRLEVFVDMVTAIWDSKGELNE